MIDFQSMGVGTQAVSRRQMLQIGALGAGLSLSGYLRAMAAGAAKSAAESDRSAVLIFLKGGPSHQDTFDLKPAAPAEYRGQFRPIRTNVAGMQICEHLPRLAKIADRLALIRGVSHNLADHGLGARYLMTGNRPSPTVKHPTFGCVANHQLTPDPELPGFVSIDRPVEGPGYLGSEFGPLSTGEKPRFGQPFRVRGVTLGEGLSIGKYRSRRKLLDDIDTVFDGAEKQNEQVRSLDKFSEQAFRMISSPKARDAFDMTREPMSENERFGLHEFGQSMLLTTRLIESGVRFVTVLIEDWDTHQDNFNTLAGRLLPPFDRALTAFLDRLQEKGNLEKTSILVTGEFGRTPKINGRAGRDHWARSMCSLFAGGSVKTGQVIGASNAKAEEPVDRVISPDDVAASFYRSIGLDPKMEFESNIGRPITLVREGAVIPELF